MLYFVILFSLLLIGAILIAFKVSALASMLKKKDGDAPLTSVRSNKVNAWLFLLFLVAGLTLFFAYSFSEFDRYTVPVASEHGEVTFRLFWITTAITGIAFIGTNVMLMFFAFKYRQKENNKARFYPHNNKLEVLWTVIPAIVLSLLVFSGWRAWDKITGPAPDNAEVLEIMGQQYAWLFRYPGPDGRLGPSNYKLIDADNKMGVDFLNPNAQDDFFPREIHLPKGVPVLFKIRARDVIHSVYVPQFRVQMNAVPGMPTQFWFIPNKTTKEMQAETGDPDYVFELVCNKICGKAHFSMRSTIVVEEKEEYEKWKASQKSWLSQHPDYLSTSINSPIKLSSSK